MSRDREHHEKDISMLARCFHQNLSVCYTLSSIFPPLPIMYFWMMKTYAHLLSQSYSIMIEAAVLFGLSPAFGLDWPVYLPVLCCLTFQKSIYYILPCLSLLLGPFANIVEEKTWQVPSIHQYPITRTVNRLTTKGQSSFSSVFPSSPNCTPLLPYVQMMKAYPTFAVSSVAYARTHFVLPVTAARPFLEVWFERSHPPIEIHCLSCLNLDANILKGYITTDFIYLRSTN